MSTADKLLYLQDTKSAIKDAIVAKGVDVPIGTTFREYANKIGGISGGSTSQPISEPWVRPTEWLALPDNVDGVQKISILNAVFDTDSEFVAMVFEGDYTIDWGDEVIEDFTSGVKAEHKYEYSNVSLNSATVTKFGYKQCVITITPQLGNNITAINLSTYHSVIGSNSSYRLSTGFLDLRINSLSCNILYIGVGLSIYVTHTMLEQCIIGEIVCTNASNMFNSCHSLQSVPLFDLGSCTNVSGMLSNCYSLQSVPLFDLGSCTNASGMLNSCVSLQSVPLFDLSACTNASYMLAGCYSLESVPLFNLSACTNVSGMLSNCRSLQSVPLFDLGSCTNASSMFFICHSLQSVPLFNLSACTNVSNMFTSCYSLQSVPLFDLGSCTNVSNMLSNCQLLKSVPLFDLGSCTNALGMLTSCVSLQSVPFFDLSSCTNASDMLSGCYSLKRVLAQIGVSFSVANAKMSATALNEMYSILPTVTGKTVTVTGNYGASTCDPTIATAKGWTVVR